jgi:hypothetical protein
MRAVRASTVSSQPRKASTRRGTVIVATLFGHSKKKVPSTNRWGTRPLDVCTYSGSGKARPNALSVESEAK